jgi:hypothetical protein
MTKARKVGIVSIFTLLLAALWGSPAMAAQNLTVNFANAPQGTHFVPRTPTPSCTVTSTEVTCPTRAFELAGVGNTNASATLEATFSAIVDCFNPGVNPNNPIESHSQTTSVSATSGTLSPKNGRLTVNPITRTGPTDTEFQALATCPNPNWTARVRPGSIQLVVFTYTVTFAGFSGPAITITGDDPPAPSGAARTGGGGRPAGSLVWGLGALTVATGGGVALVLARRRREDA